MAIDSRNSSQTKSPNKRNIAAAASAAPASDTEDEGHQLVTAPDSYGGDDNDENDDDDDDSTLHLRDTCLHHDSDQRSFPKSLLLFVNCFLNVPMWSMALCLIVYISACIYTPYHWLRYVLWSYIPYILIDHSRATSAGHHNFSEALRNSFWLKAVAKYYPVQLHKTCDLDPQTSYIFLYHPHGVISMGANCALSTNACDFDRIFPNIPRHGVTLNASFLCPIWREYLMGLGFVSADKFTLRRILKNKSSIVLVPGGAAEALLAEPGTFRLIARRQGFVKLALDTHAQLVPCLGFGENRVFETIHLKPKSRGYRIQQMLCKILSFSTPLLSHPFPIRAPIDVVVGKPVRFQKAVSVEECKKQYMEAVQNLYAEHKALYGYDQVPLEWWH